MIKKKSLIVGALLVSVILAGCTKNEPQEEPPRTVAEDLQTEVQEGSVSKADEKAEEEPIANMANPIEEVADAAAINSALGMSIDTCMMPEIDRFAIIGKKMAEIVFSLTSVDGDPLNCVFRATKDAEMAENIHGIYDTDLIDGSSTEYEGDNGIVNIDYVYANTEKTDIWTWKFNDTYYSFTMDNEASQMTIGAMLDSLMVACGADTPGEEFSSGDGVIIAPLHEEVDLTNLGDRTISASLLPDSMKKTDDGISVDFELYTKDIYDAVEMTTLKEGDTVIVESEPILVESISIGDSIKINGGVDEGGAEFISNGGGTFRYFGFDDYATYTDKGRATLTVTKDTVIMDYSDPSNADGVKVDPDKFMEYVNTPQNSTSFTFGNTEIRTEGGKLVEITRKYVP